VKSWEDRKKKEEEQRRRKKGDGIQTGELDAEIR
jgi:hypothetical protein